MGAQERPGVIKIKRLRYRVDMTGRHHNGLGIGAEPRAHGGHPVTDSKRRDVLPKGCNGTGTFDAGNKRKRRLDLVQAAYQQGVGKVDPDRGDVDENLVGPGYRVWHLLHRKILNGSECLADNSLHKLSPLVIAIFNPISASNGVSAPTLTACSLDALPSSARLRTPWHIAASLKKLKAR